MFHEKEKQSQQKRQFFVPAGCKAYQWVQYSQTLYRFIPRLVPKWKIKEKKLAHQRPSYTTQTVSNIPIFPRFDRYPTPSTHFPALFSSINVFPPKIPPSFLLDEIKWTFIPCMRKNKAEFNKSNYTNSWSNLWNTSLIVSFKASSRLSSASTNSASFSSIAAVQYRLNPFFCDCRVYSSGILRTESGISSW